MQKLYTLGYATWTLEQIEKAVIALDALLIDIRYHPWSGKPGFNREDLTRRFPGIYGYMKSFGNLTHKEGRIELYKPEEGLQKIGPILKVRNVVLLCGCSDYQWCHRSTVADLIAERYKVEVEHLTDPKKYSSEQLSLDM